MLVKLTCQGIAEIGKFSNIRVLPNYVQTRRNKVERVSKLSGISIFY